MARLFDNPMSMLLILLVVMLLFGAPKLPGMARIRSLHPLRIMPLPHMGSNCLSRTQQP